MVETRHIRLGFEEALSGKKELLSSEIDLLHIGKRIKNYKVLRKKELAAKRNLKTEMNGLRSKVGLILSSFPEGEGKAKVQKRVRRIEKEERKDFHEELDEIKKKLEMLEK